jgi:DNA-binding transcriptional MerR regulator
MTTTRTTTFTPAETAERTGFSLDTLRYYERAGILDSVARTAGGRRAYTEADLGWLGMVRCLRDTGMPIARLREYAELARDDETVPERLELLERHDAVVQQQVDALLEQQRVLRDKIAYYRSLRTEGGRMGA